jgi:hypothetical protein
MQKHVILKIGLTGKLLDSKTQKKRTNGGGRYALEIHAGLGSHDFHRHHQWDDTPVCLWSADDGACGASDFLRHRRYPVFFYALIVSGRLPLANAGQAWFVGVIWLVLTIAFEFGFGLFIAGHSLGRLLHDYHIAEGRLWLIVLICLFLMPYTVFQIRRQKRPQKISASTKSP